ncbi:UNVERIFIED_CONTAM: hypothetical protein H355_011837 [Colinus virginianus]|nr:hypothetical protein H355_011837 [Colinus virginianus]
MIAVRGLTGGGKHTKPLLDSPSTTRSTACSPCPPGHYTNELGAAACSACQKGRAAGVQPCVLPSHCTDFYLWSDVILAHSKTQLSVCPARLDRSATPAAAQCVCPVLLGTRLCVRLLRSVCCAGQRSLGPVPDANVLFCRLGTFKGPEDDACKPCEPGEYQLQRGRESCDLCPENHYCPSPDVNPIKCPPDAFCPMGSTSPQYCMEVFLYKVGSSCQLTPLVIVLLALFSAGAILIIFVLILRRRQEHSSKSLKSLLLPRGSEQHTMYGVMEHTEPVYAGW